MSLDTAPASPSGRRLILSLGSVNIDIIAYSDALPRPGETIHASRYAMGLGGKGANQAAAASRLAGSLGLTVELAGRTGDDAFGELARGHLAGFGVGLAALARDPGQPTGIALIGVDAAGENTVTVVGGANMALDATDGAAIGPLLDQAAVLLLQLETPLPVSLEAARRARRGGASGAGGALVILDPAPAPLDGLPEEAWALIDLVTPNETETERLVGIRPTDPASAAVAADRLQAKGLTRAIVKLGARGVFWRDGRESGFVPPFQVNAIDSVAAGDCFNGGLAVAMARGDRFGEAVRFAAACGALATTKRGAAEAAPTLDEVLALLG
ncbi:ribokinase [Lichenicola sp.]|uniref:ribokinase n=1 Tax=Lichenicola sp. TaxID=2804529 RepID=UPI003AFFA32B